ncbi:MAG: SUMF1/EgtB/PvdO family nonheme iron enzyme, partial [Anaerolineales bacterium]|nr:SUMF1/EgtB/PvdO family nonheme iron enzyme [Anaerolineales bacterium]
TLGRYKIEEHIGSGAYADVYRAMDTTLKRTVALKVLKPMLLADEEAFARFVQEAQTAAGLFHPHIATVLDLGEAEAEGRYFLAMRYVDGPSLDMLLAERGLLPWEGALRITEQIAGALQFAHDKGLIHRDIKPQNILVSQNEGAVLTDFGLVKAMATSGLTTTGTFLGTPNYMAPEIWKDEEITHAVDQYALACVLVEMLTGEVLYNGNTPPAVMAKHFQPPGLPGSWPDGISAGIVEVLEKALVQDPGDRCTSMAEFAAALKSDRYSIGLIQPKGTVMTTDPQSNEDDEDLSGLVTPDNPAGIEWVEIPAGEFLYGDEKNPHYIRASYLIDKYPVTNAQYKSFLDANPNQKAPSSWDKKKCMYPSGKENHPVVKVSWHDAMAFCNWAKCRLPTEEEWEKAARATDGRIYPWGDDWVGGKYCNSSEVKLNGTSAVNEFPEGVSPYGIWDLSGNVWEWTASRYDTKEYALCGGAWRHDGNYVRVTFRNYNTPDRSYINVGFRCARDAGKSLSEK